MKVVGISSPTFRIGDFSNKFKYTLSVIQQFSNPKELTLLVFPELFTTGYPPKDALYIDDFVSEQYNLMQKLSKALQEYPNVMLLVGAVEKDGNYLYNSAFLINSNSVKPIARKRHLPNYDIFNEKRYFTPGDKPSILEFSDGVNTIRVGVSICEDLWIANTIETLVANNADIIVSLNASPYTRYKLLTIVNMLIYYESLYHIPILYVNWNGGQDEIIYSSKCFLRKDGKIYRDSVIEVRLDKNYINKRHSKFLKDKRIIDGLHDFRGKCQITTIKVSNLYSNSKQQTNISGKDSFVIHSTEELVNAICLGIADYFRLNNLKNAVIGLSGGVDSTTVLFLLEESRKRYNLPENIYAYFMPTQFTQKESYEVVNECQKLTQFTQYQQINIDSLFETMWSIFDKQKLPTNDHLVKIAKQNLQARIRGLLLSTISNMIPQSIVVACGNKTEYALGYATLYGDMVGGIAPLKDVYKTEVYEIGEYLKIPKLALERKPSAELDANQSDESDLGFSYAEIDAILMSLIEDVYFKHCPDEIVNRLLANEYKRRQSPIGFKLHESSFENRQFPIAISLK